MFHTYLFIAYLYTAVRVIAPLPIRIRWRILLGLALLAVSKYHFVVQLVNGNMFSPELPFWMMFLLGWSFCAFVLLFVLTLLSDAVSLLIMLIRFKRFEPRTALTLKAGTVIASVLLAGYGVFQAAQVPDVKPVTLRIDGLPTALEGVKIVQLTDLHISRFFQRDWVSQVVAKTNALNPDLILITGDLIDGTTEARDNDVAPLADLNAKYGVITSLGNHEYYFESEQWAEKFRDLGMEVLENEHDVLSINGEELIISGVTDESATDYGLDGPDVEAAMSGAPADVPSILLDHRPSDAEDNSEHGIDIQLSGHTHGGMIKGIDLIAGYENQGYVSGMYRIGGMELYVSNGTGLWNGFPIRLGVPAEITEFTLSR